MMPLRQLTQLPQPERHAALLGHWQNSASDPIQGETRCLTFTSNATTTWACPAPAKWRVPGPRKAEEKFDMECTYEEGDTQDALSFARSGSDWYPAGGRTAIRHDGQARLPFSAFKDRIETEISGQLDELLARPAPLRWPDVCPAHAPSVLISEVGPRDGLQSIATTMPTAHKLRWVDALVAALREIEVGSFVPAKLLPQMADVAEVVRHAVAWHPAHHRDGAGPNLRGAGRTAGRGAW